VTVGFNQIGFGVRVKVTSQVGSVRRQCKATILINRSDHNILSMTWLHEIKHNCETWELLVLPEPNMKTQMLFEKPAAIYKLARRHIPQKVESLATEFNYEREYIVKA
jgi:hypothetical protein